MIDATAAFVSSSNILACLAAEGPREDELLEADCRPPPEERVRREEEEEEVGVARLPSQGVQSWSLESAGKRRKKFCKTSNGLKIRLGAKKV